MNEVFESVSSLLKNKSAVVLNEDPSSPGKLWVCPRTEPRFVTELASYRPRFVTELRFVVSTRIENDSEYVCFNLSCLVPRSIQLMLMKSGKVSWDARCLVAACASRVMDHLEPF